MRKISIQEVLNIKPDYSKASKEEVVLAWLLDVREYLLKNNLAAFEDVIPTKKEISKLLKISTGTIQNALKYAEDMGLFRSKQCIGTMISNPDIKQGFKMFSKKDKALIEIKKFLFKHDYDENEIIPGVLELAAEIKTSPNTTRLAINELILTGVLRKEVYKKNTTLILNSKIKLAEREKAGPGEVKNKNLVKILKENIRKYLSQNFKTGDKIPSNLYFAKMYNVSVRTVNSAMRELNKDKIVLSRRGAYGSIFLNTSLKEARNEKSIFMTKPKGEAGELKNNYNYKWETVLENIKNYILKNHEAGDKIPPMREFAQKLNVSVTTVKKAVKELSRLGVIYAQKGKYGGLFIVEMPQGEDSYQWLAINPDYFGEN